LAIAKLAYPAVLIVTLERWPVARDHHANPESHHQLAIGQVLYHLDHRPLPWPLGPTEGRIVNLVQPATQPRQQFLQHVYRLTASQEIEQRAHVAASG